MYRLNMKPINLLVGCVIGIMAFGNSAICCQQAAQKAPAIDQDEAEKLVSAALEPGGATKLPGYYLESSTQADFPDFYFVHADWNNPSGGGIGYYAVDMRTGDVWSAAVCYKEKSRPLRKLQKTLRLRLGMSRQEYKRLRRLGPMCGPGERPLKY
jgi:hypothetical protein